MQEITPSEWRLMRVIWTLKFVTSAKLIKVMQEMTEWSPSTIKTLLKRLEAKGFVANNGEARNRTYYATVKEIDTMNEQLNTLFSAMCAHKTGQALAEVLETLSLSQNDCQHLIEVLQEKIKIAPEHIHCNCLPSDEKCCH
ncbi:MULTISPECIES: CopY/TcrY family copper transport repressor [unclassified Enterococcus]|uniref:CopY/TcrY family copper transport repressor n=1 Tax=unclassified Enterococcus TaxID=2608891 RepID=UPI001555A8B7|nr:MULTISPECIES: CopY/TcrY family copper transport repressor [unclassified Enterococcus]MBS7577932.1 CopY/TcrY family copper transport repressor [Enterococcus sp. MMGLQ5-2]MBS7585207.1 CopY/TcrY family copper transport repressor [Enterococcus sp. MMGLQ5-1]NPD13064.1 CopY/TcrY family copper transport repressor [Enterococcus sp. MMGLQ5-1]NPD37762.1 CopY/TcrY family copper transport repressor [Enterococcus sp. MMGLQ5-2]